MVPQPALLGDLLVTELEKHTRCTEAVTLTVTGQTQQDLLLSTSPPAQCSSHRPTMIGVLCD